MPHHQSRIPNALKSAIASVFFIHFMLMVTEAELGGAQGGICRGKLDFQSLPEVCIDNVISFTSPRDACRLSLVSSTFRSAAESDAVWEKFLPSDYQSIISQSSAAPSLCFSTKKELYFSLCEKPLLIDEGKKSFLLEKSEGKKCYMLSARNLFIVWGDTPRYWRWSSVVESKNEMGSTSVSSRFAEVAELISVCWLEIRGSISTRMLSPSTLYAAYLVFKTTGGTYGFDYQPVEACIGIAGQENPRRKVYLDAERGRGLRYRYVTRLAGIANRAHFVPVEVPSEDADSQQFPKERGDGWLEIELGDFFNQGGEENELEMVVSEVTSGDWKGGIIVQGIDIRPKSNK